MSNIIKYLFILYLIFIYFYVLLELGLNNTLGLGFDITQFSQSIKVDYQQDINLIS